MIDELPFTKLLHADRAGYPAFFQRASLRESAEMMTLFAARRVYLMTVQRPAGEFPTDVRGKVEKLTNQHEALFLVCCEWVRCSRAFAALTDSEKNRIQSELFSVSFESLPH